VLATTTYDESDALETLRGTVEGTFDYRTRGRKADAMKMTAAVESRPK